MKGLVLAGGYGTRLRPITHTSNKHLIPLANKPLLFYAIETLKTAGIKDIGIIVGHTEQRIREIKEAVGDGSDFGIKVTYIEQDAPRGIAHAIKIAEDFLLSNNKDEKFVVHLGDNILKTGIKKYLKKFLNPKVNAMILLKTVENPQRFGIAEVKESKVVKLVEKPKNPKSNLAITGIYFLDKSVFNAIDKLKPSWRNEYEITEAIQGVIDNGENVEYDIIDADWWKDPGDLAGVLEANRLLLDELIPFNMGKVEKGATVIGKVGVDKGTIIKSGSSVEGPVIIGKNCVIGGSYIGPHTSIGDNTIINNAEIESSIIIGDCKIECERRIVDSLIGKNVNVTSSNKKKPKSVQLVIGENSFVSI